MKTQHNASMDGSFESLPFGDGYSASGTDDDAYHFATLDQDVNDNDHAQYREYSSMTGRWMSPDPYSGSYNLTDPQSFNRYAYVMNNPLAFTDPTGRICAPVPGAPEYTILCGAAGKGIGAWLSTAIPYIGWGIDIGLTIDDLGKLFGWWGVPQFHGTLRPRPSSGCNVSANSINQYIAHAKPSSPLIGQGSAFMATGLKYNLDPRLLVSLSGAETTFGTDITAGQFNALNVMYNGHNSPFPSFQSNINAAGKSLTNPANEYNLSNTATMYGRYCSGSGCATGLKNLNTFMRQQGANTNELHNPCGPQE